jgi:hypothetical protein
MDSGSRQGILTNGSAAFIDCANERKKEDMMKKVKVLWQKLRDIPTDDKDCIELPFQHFQVGTHREEIWHWFEDSFGIAVFDLMNS